MIQSMRKRDGQIKATAALLLSLVRFTHLFDASAVYKCVVLNVLSLLVSVCVACIHESQRWNNDTELKRANKIFLYVC